MAISRLKIFLLGPPQVELDNTPLEIKRRKVLALLAYLAVSGQPQRRDSLAALLWPDSTQRSARGALRRHLSELNKLLGGDWLEADRETASLRSGTDRWLDVAQFQAHLAACRDHGHAGDQVCPDCLPLLTEAAALYRAGFLSGFTLSDSPDFDDWQYFQAEGLRQALASALERLAGGYLDQGDPKTAIPHARRWLSLDPLHESAHRTLMRLYAGSGQQAAALRQYQTCTEMLEAEFGVTPSDETTAVYEQIRAGVGLQRSKGAAEKGGTGEHAPTPPPFLIAGRYQIIDRAEDLIGQGSMGHVFKGRDTQSGQIVAIKALRAEFLAGEGEGVERFAREGEALRQLNHPNIVQLLDAVEEDDQPYLVMEYVEGGSLRDLLNRSGPLPLERILQIGLELCDALTQTHYQGIIHRDIKPANILLDKTGRPRLTDFGVARLGQAERVTQTGSAIGTVDYLSPEALNGEAVDARTDIWSLGVLLYELLARERPFAGETLTEVLTAILTRPSPDLATLRPDVPAPLVDLISRMMEKDPAERIASVRLIGAELEAIMQGRGAEGQGSPYTPTPPPRHNLPPQPTTFIGREEELAQITARLADPDCRLLTLLGPGGIGKTRLALETAQRLLTQQTNKPTAQPPNQPTNQLTNQPTNQLTHTITFVSLAGLNSHDGLVSAIAGGLGFTFYSEADPRQQLLDYLRGKSALLILDNFEHLLDGAPLTSEILAAAPGVKILATSREVLNLAEEWLQPVAGMPYPAGDGDRGAWVRDRGSGVRGQRLGSREGYSALELFAQRAVRVAPDFSLEAELADASRICQLVDGMPLGVELAAARRKQFSCQTIAGQIEGGLDFLATSLRNIPERHRSMRAVFESSWDLLSEREQTIVSKLSVFRGGFRLEAAQAVAGASLIDLTGLVDKSLLRVSQRGRYDLHELLRQFAQAKLEAASTEFATTQETHGQHYLTFVANREDDLKGARQQAAMVEIGAELDNIQVAWNWAVVNLEVTLLSRTADALGIYYEWRGYYQAGTSAFQAASIHLATKSDNDILPVLSKMLVWQSIFTRLQGQIQSSDECLQKSLTMLEMLEKSGKKAEQEKAFALLQMGSAKCDPLPKQAKHLGEQSLALYQDIDDQWGVANACYLLGRIGASLSDRQIQAHYHEAGLKIRRRLNDRRGIASSLAMLAEVAHTYHWDIEKSAHLSQESVAIRREIGDEAGLADGLIVQGYMLTVSGKPADAESHFHESLQLASNLGNKDIIGGAHAWLAHALIHKGDYKQASLEAQSCLALASEIWAGPIRSALMMLALVKIAQERYDKAKQILEENSSILADDYIGSAWACTSHVYIHLAQHQFSQAQSYLKQAFQETLKIQHTKILLYVIPAASLFLAHRDQPIRAIELYTLASRYPFVANSRWFFDVIGRRLEASSVALSPGEVAVARERGRARDLWQTAQELLAEFQEAEKQGRKGERSPAPPHPSPPSPQRRHNLPVQTTPFIGRQTELEELSRLLAEPAIRLVTILGPGGMGKTRLALEAAQAQLGRFENGVYFVRLAPLDSPESIAPAIAEALSFSFYEGGAPEQQLQDYLKEKQVLLLMDNYEHLMAGVEIVVDLLKVAPGLKILATSRASLNVQEEQRFPLKGIDFPVEADAAGIGRSAAAQLFLESARRVQPRFELTDEVAVARICRLVDGMPLGIILAATWVEVLSVAEIADELSKGLDLLEAEMRDLPERQRSMRAVFEHSWRLLSEQEQTILQSLSVFRGGFSREAAEAVAGASLRDLMALVNKSLLIRAAEGRYEIHELLRQFVADKLAHSPTALEAAPEKHSSHYLTLLQQREVDLKGAGQQAALAEINAEIENIRAAWRWALTHQQSENLAAAVDSLGLFCEWSGRYQDGEHLFATAAAKLTPPKDQWSTTPGQVLRLLSKLLTWQAVFSQVQGNQALADQLLEKSLAILDSPALANQPVQAEKAFLLLQKEILSRPDTIALEDAKSLCEQSLALYKAAEDRWGMADALDRLGWVLYQLSERNSAKSSLEQSLSLYRSLGHQWEMSVVLGKLALVNLALGDLDEAERLPLEALEIGRKLSSRQNVAFSLSYTGFQYIDLGKYSEARSMLQESLAILRDINFPLEVAYQHRHLSFAEVHLGHYEQAQQHAQMGLELFQKLGQVGVQGLGHCFITLGMVALASGVYDEAQQHFQKAISILKVGHKLVLGKALIGLVYPTRALGEHLQARRYLLEALQAALESQDNRLLTNVLPPAALLLVDLDQPERAVELYSRALQHPHIANSRWFENVAGRQIDAIAKTLPPEVVAVARERGRSRDLWGTAEELLAELEGQPSL